MIVKYIFDDGGRLASGYRGTTGDCVSRAIAIVLNQPYDLVYKSLNSARDSLRQTKRVRSSSARTGVSRVVYDRFLKSLGFHFVPTMSIGSGCKVHLRDGELPMGRIICRVSRHLVAVIDGVIHDTFDCSRDGTRCVYGYYIMREDL
jgi:hypothetical protein